MSSRFSTETSSSGSSIFLKSGEGFPIFWPASTSFRASSQLWLCRSDSYPSIFHSRADENGRNGAESTHRPFTMRKATCSDVPQASLSTFTRVHGPTASKYWFPNRARDIIFFIESFNLTRSRFSSTSFHVRSIFSKASSSLVVILTTGGTSPKCLLTNVSTLCTKFPYVASSSVLFLVTKSFHVKSESLFSGMLTVR